MEKEVEEGIFSFGDRGKLVLTRVTSGAPPGGGGALGSLAHTIPLQFWLYIFFDRLARELETRTNLNGQCQ